MSHSDLLIVGGGPAGLSAAINAASEGLCVRLVDTGPLLGGQARESSAIENYPGFPSGVSGDDLMFRFIEQAVKFRTLLLCPHQIAELRTDSGEVVFVSSDFSEYTARCALISVGLSYRRLGAAGTGRLMGRGVSYGMPSVPLSPRRACRIGVVGGANSAGQAVLRLASIPRVEVVMLVRRGIRDQMSTYLMERILSLPNVSVIESCEVVSVHGADWLQHVSVRIGEEVQCLELHHLMIFIGAVPQTLWLQSAGMVLDERRFVSTWPDVGELPFETSVRGVFAAGDVRAGSIKRIASAIGEGAAAVQMIHRRLAA